MALWIGRSVLLALWLAQVSEPTLEQQYALATGGGSHHALVTLIELHEDGTPVRGFIACSGWWQKYQDLQTDEEPVFYENLAFRTDSRGAIVMNPHTDNEWVHCWSSDKGKHGSVTVQFDEDDPFHVVTFILNGKESTN